MLVRGDQGQPELSFSVSEENEEAPPEDEHEVASAEPPAEEEHGEVCCMLSMEEPSPLRASMYNHFRSLRLYPLFLSACSQRLQEGLHAALFCILLASRNILERSWPTQEALAAEEPPRNGVSPAPKVAAAEAAGAQLKSPRTKIVFTGAKPQVAASETKGQGEGRRPLQVQGQGHGQGRGGHRGRGIPLGGVGGLRGDFDAGQGRGGRASHGPFPPMPGLAPNGMQPIKTPFVAAAISASARGTFMLVKCLWRPTM